MISIKRQQQWAAHTDLWVCRGCQTLQSVKEIDNEVTQKFRNDFEHLRNYVRYSVTIDW